MTRRASEPRDSARRPSPSRELFIRTALEIVDIRGIGQLGLVEAGYAEIQVDPDEAETVCWRDTLAAFARQLRAPYSVVTPTCCR